MTDLPVVDPTTGDIDQLAADHPLELAKALDMFGDSIPAVGYDLAAEAVRDALSAAGWGPTHPDAVAELSRLLDEARTERDEARAKARATFLESAAFDELRRAALVQAKARLAAYQELETAAKAWAAEFDQFKARGASMTITAPVRALRLAVAALPEAPASPPGSTLSDEPADTGAASTPDVQAATGTTGAPLLGLATTRQLLEEIKARGEVEAAVGYYTATAEAMAIGAANLLDSLPGSMLSYRTVDEPPTHTEERDGN